MIVKKKNKFSLWGIIKIAFLFLIIIEIIPIAFNNLRDLAKETFYPRPQIGHLKLEGFIGNSQFFVKKIRSFAKKEEIKGLFLQIDSPGGTPASSQAIFNELKKFKEKKPIVSLVENVCASGAYYVACASNSIISQKSSLIGSIGTFAQLPNIKGLMDDWKIKFKFIQSGKYKTAGNPFYETTPEEINYLQQLSDNIYIQFINDVSSNRNLNKKEITKWADGKVFTGNQAIKLKLIDKIGSITDAIDEIKKLTGIKQEEEIAFVKAKQKSAILKYISPEEDEDEFSFSSYLINFFSTILNNVIEKQSASRIHQCFS